jgi:surfactin synthase thioesterase subunit
MKEFSLTDGLGDTPNRAAASWFPTSMTAPDPLGHLFCFPHAGGGTAQYHRWKSRLASVVQVVPVCLPGRERRWKETPITDVDTLCARFLDALRSQPLQRLTLFGHSMGGLLAYEAARRLIAEDRVELVGIFVSACPAPHRIADRRRRLLSDDELIKVLVADFSTDGTRSSDEIEIMRSLLPAIRADFTLFETYSPPADLRLPVPIYILGGSEDPHIALSKLEAWRECSLYPGPVRTFPGGHFYWQNSAQEEQVLRFIADKLTRK